MNPKPGQQGPAWGLSERVPSSYRAVQDRAANAQRELFDQEFASKRIEEINKHRVEKIGALREVTGENVRRMSSEVSTSLFKTPAPRVNYLYGDFQDRRLFLVNRLFSKSVNVQGGHSSDYIPLQQPQQQVETTELASDPTKSQELYAELFADNNFRAICNEFEKQNSLAVKDPTILESQPYRDLKKSLEDIFAKQNPPITFDNPEFVKFRNKLRQENFDVVLKSISDDGELDELDRLYSIKEPTNEDNDKIKVLEGQLGEKFSAQGLTFDRDALKEFFKEKKKEAIYQEIAKLKETDPDLYNWAYAQLDTIDAALKAGKITQEESEVLSNEVLQKVIKASSDKNLKKMWTDYSTKQEVTAVTPNVSGAMDAAKPYFEGSGLVLSSSGFGGGCSVETTDSTNFSCEISVDKDDKGNFKYSIEDPVYANNGVDGPYTAEELAEAVDSRHMDVYLTKELRRAGLDKAGDVGNAPDSQIVNICKSLVGSGKDRGYKLADTNLDIIQGLIKVLKQEDPEYSTIGRKLYGLSIFLRGDDKSRVLKVRSACLPSDVEKPIFSVSSVIGVGTNNAEGLEEEETESTGQKE